MFGLLFFKHDDDGHDEKIVLSKLHLQIPLPMLMFQIDIAAIGSSVQTFCTLLLTQRLSGKYYVYMYLKLDIDPFFYISI